MFAVRSVTDIIREVLFWSALGLTGIAVVDWMVRTRRIGPFNPVARFFRKTIDPLMAPVERRIVRSGGLPSHAPWWTLAVLIVGGILLLTLIGYLTTLAGTIAYVVKAPSQIPRVAIVWTIGLLRIAIIVRVISSWTRLGPYSPWTRWSFTLTEWMLAPLRRVIPMLGVVDITPLVAYFGLGLLGSVFG